MIIIANILAFIAATIMLLNGVVKDKRKFLFIQILQIFISLIANVLLGARTGIIVNLFSILRNILVCFNKSSLLVSILIVCASAISSVLMNNKGVIGVLPLLSTVPYSLLLYKLNDKQLKKLTLFTQIPWAIYDFCVKNYVACAFDIGTEITLFTGLLRIYNSKPKRKYVKKYSD